MSTSAAKLAVYTDMEDLDFAIGQKLLESAGFEVRYLNTQDSEEIVAGAAGASALLVGYASITAEMMDALPDLRIIALVAMGFDNVDVDAARERGIWVTNLPGVATEEVATHAVAMVLAALRELAFFDDRVRAGDWLSRPDRPVLRLSEQRFGLVGLGRIGQKTAELARPFFGEIVGYDPYLPDTDETRARLAELGIRRVELAELLADSAAVSLHVPLAPETKAMVNTEFLAQMRPDAVLVNVSRGQLVNVDDLVAALDAGVIRSAALDVFDVEPAPSTHPLASHPKVLASPHVAFMSERTLVEYVRIQAQNVASYFETGRPDTPLFEALGHTA